MRVIQLLPAPSAPRPAVRQDSAAAVLCDQAQIQADAVRAVELEWRAKLDDLQAQHLRDAQERQRAHDQRMKEAVEGRAQQQQQHREEVQQLQEVVERMKKEHADAMQRIQQAASAEAQRKDQMLQRLASERQALEEQLQAARRRIQALEGNNLMLADHRFSEGALAQLRPPAALVRTLPNSQRKLYCGVAPPSWLHALWATSGEKDRPVRGFCIQRFDALAVPDNDNMVTLLLAKQQRLKQLRASNIPEYQGQLGALSPLQQDAKKQAIRWLKQRLVPPYRDVNLLYSFHGSRLSLVESILQNGLVALHRQDGGFFGRGIYVTPHIEYAARYASGEFFAIDPPSSAQPWMPADSLPVIVCASFVSLAYPVTRDADYNNLQGIGHNHSDFFAKQGEPARSLKVGCDAHVVSVAGNDGFQACPPKYAEYYELVHAHDELVLPMGVLWVRPA
jgi:archaellum component FlaC